ncbi:MAG: serine hydroxymethyltransferase [Clostridia bacterium]|nr:serine hydroxymethyltransferase [Clostridia bacterium]
MNSEDLKNVDVEIYKAIENEKQREHDHLELIASENYVSKAVLQALASPLTNKYAEGYPNKRYYGGCEFVDVAESLAIERAKKLFKCDHVNVQPHCGSNANFAVYYALLKPGDTILGMDLSNGGHLTHGSKVNVSGKIFNSVFYGVDDNGYIDYDNVLKIALINKPKLIIAGASAYSRKIDFQKFREIADKVGAYLMVDMAHIAGLVAAGLHQSPVPYADVVTLTTHKTLRGPRGGMILCKEKFAKEIDKAVFPGSQGGPLMHVIAAKAVSFKEALDPSFKLYQQQVINNAKEMEKVFKERKIEMVSGGTDNHLILLNLSDRDLSGKELEDLLQNANISTNKNTVPNEKRKPSIASGLRIGAPAVTTRGFKEKDMRKVANLISDVILEKEKIIPKVKEKVKELCDEYPVQY